MKNEGKTKIASEPLCQFKRNCQFPFKSPTAKTHIQYIRAYIKHLTRTIFRLLETIYFAGQKYKQKKSLKQSKR